MARAPLTHWFPFSPADWRSLTAGLSTTAAAAFLELRCAAWEAPNRNAPPCTLPDDDEVLARIARLERKEFARISRALRDLFVVEDGRLLDRPLLTLWTVQTAGYEARAAAGRAGNEAKAKRAQAEEESARNADALRPQSAPEREREGDEGRELPAPSGAGVALAPSRDGATAPATPSPAAPSTVAPAASAGAGFLTGDPRRRLLEPTSPAALQVEATAAAVAERAALERRFLEARRRKVDEWAADNADAWLEISSAERRSQGIPLGKKLEGFVADMHRAAIDEAVARAQGWPDLDEWIAKTKAKDARRGPSAPPTTATGDPTL